MRNTIYLVLLVSVVVIVFVLRRGWRVVLASAKNVTNWGGIKHFSPHEFDSPDAPGTGQLMKHSFVKILDKLRSQLNQPFHINSGYRTQNYNADLRSRGYKAATNSAHLKGLAADIHCPDIHFMSKLVKAARRQGVKRIGQYRTSNGKLFVHLDVDKTKLHQGEWAMINGSKSEQLIIQ